MHQPQPPLAQESPPLRREIVRLAWPVFAEQILGTLAQTVDMILVGPLGAISVAAVGLSTQPTFILIGPSVGIGAGLGALVARFAGARTYDDARRAARQGLWLGLVLAVVIGVLVWWQAPGIIRLMGGEPDVVPVAAAYLRALAPGLAAMLWSLVMGAVPRAAGDTRTPFYISLGVNLLNLVLAWAFIYGHLGLPAMGLVGAGVATSIARILGALTLLVVLLRGTEEIRLEPARLFELDWALLKRIFAVGVPAAAERLATSGAYIVFTIMISTMGTVVQAAHYTAVIAENVSWMLGSGLTAACATIVGQSLGAKNPQRAGQAIREGVKLGAMLAVPLTVLFLTIPQYYMQIFSQDPQVISLAASALRAGASAELPMILSLVYSGALTGAGNSRAVFLISLAGGWIVRISLAVLFIFGLKWGLPGAWAATVADWTARMGLFYWRFRSGHWANAKV